MLPQTKSTGEAKTGLPMARKQKKQKNKTKNKTKKQTKKTKLNKKTKKTAKEKKPKKGKKNGGMVECTVGRRKNRLCVWRSVLAADRADRADREVGANRGLVRVARRSAGR